MRAAQLMSARQFSRFASSGVRSECGKCLKIGVSSPLFGIREPDLRVLRGVNFEVPPSGKRRLTRLFYPFNSSAFRKLSITSPIAFLIRFSRFCLPFR